MDLLNTILNSMEAPPTNEQQKKLIKKQKELAERMREKQKEELMRFRKYVEERLSRFAKDERPFIEFQPLDKVHRSVIHEVAEYGGFLALSFGREDIDRYSVVYKKENAPTEDEIAARRNGDGWNEEIAKEYAEHRKLQEIEKEQRRLARIQAVQTQASEETTEIKPNSNYKDKYVHLIGQESALKAARKTETNLNYGFVPSKNKKDMRSIEQTLADIQAKKRRRIQEQKEEQEKQLQQQEQEQEQQELTNEVQINEITAQEDEDNIIAIQNQ